MKKIEEKKKITLYKNGIILGIVITLSFIFIYPIIAFLIIFLTIIILSTSQKY